MQNTVSNTMTNTLDNTLAPSLPLAEQALVKPDFSDASPAIPVNKPCVVRGGDALIMEMPGEKGFLKLPSDKTAGRITVGTLEAGVNGGPPPHLHANEEEIFLVQSGAFELFLNGETFEARAGDMAYLSRGEAHRFRGLDSGEDNRFDIIIAPGGFEKFFARWAPLLQKGAPDPQEAAALCGEYGIELFPGDEFAPVALKSQSKIVRAGEAPVLDVLGDRTQVLLTAKETGGRYTLVRTEGPVDSGPPLHIHENEDELFLIEEGSIEFTLGHEKIVAHSGDVVWAPRGSTHTFRRLTDGARMVVFMTPGGMDNFFFDCDKLAATGDFSPQSVIELCAQYGITVLPPQVNGAPFQS